MIEFRPFQPGDESAVWELHDAALEDAGIHGGHGPWEDDLRDIGAAYQAAGGEFLLGFLDERLVAIGGLRRRGPEEAEIKRMRVHPEFQRRGFASRLLEELEARARALGFRAVTLDTTEEQRPARKLYEGACYREIGRRSGGQFLFIDFAKTL